MEYPCQQGMRVSVVGFDRDSMLGMTDRLFVVSSYEFNLSFNEVDLGYRWIELFRLIREVCGPIKRVTGREVAAIRTIGPIPYCRAPGT